MKRFLAVFTVLCLCLTMTATAFAVAPEAMVEDSTATLDYLNYEFPEGAEVVYQSEYGVVFRTPESATSTLADTSYPFKVEFSKNDTTLQTRQVTNPHWLGGECSGKFQMICEGNPYADASGQMLLYASNGTSLLATSFLNNGDTYEFHFNTIGKSLTLSCIPYRTPVKTTYILELY